MSSFILTCSKEDATFDNDIVLFSDQQKRVSCYIVLPCNYDNIVLEMETLKQQQCEAAQS
jgi:hypothetical protein